MIEVVGIDTFQVRVPFSNKTKYCLNIVDYSSSSHFQLVVPLAGHTAHETRVYRMWLKILDRPENSCATWDINSKRNLKIWLKPMALSFFLLPWRCQNNVVLLNQGQLYKEMFYKTLGQIICRDWPTWYQTIDLVLYQESITVSRRFFSCPASLRLPAAHSRWIDVRRRIQSGSAKPSRHWRHQCGQSHEHPQGCGRCVS